jgi:type 1 glutamine amidotransferase
MKHRLVLCGLVLLATAASGLSQTDSSGPLRVFIRAGEKTHGPGEHDYPRFLDEWKTVLTQRGAAVDGALRFPTDAELARTDVLIIYAGDAGNVAPDERARLEPYLKRGGGLVVLHDGMCGDDPLWFASVAGGAKKHGERNWHRGVLKIHFEDPSHPVVDGAPDFEMDDEMFHLLRMAPETRVLATTANAEGTIVPQLWVYEKTLSGGRPYRSFVSLQGHHYKNFSLPAYRGLLLRGIAWAGKRRPESLAGIIDDSRGPLAPRS